MLAGQRQVSSLHTDSRQGVYAAVPPLGLQPAAAAAPVAAAHVAGTVEAAG